MTSYQCNELWPRFHDVIIHDNTSKTNRYDMALNLFVAIDNNYKTRIVTQALTKYETQAEHLIISHLKSYLQMEILQC